MSRDDSHANLYSGNVTPLLPFVGEGGDEEDDEDEDDDEPFEGTNFESVIAPFVHRNSHEGHFLGHRTKEEFLVALK